MIKIIKMIKMCWAIGTVHPLRACAMGSGWSRSGPCICWTRVAPPAPPSTDIASHCQWRCWCRWPRRDGAPAATRPRPTSACPDGAGRPPAKWQSAKSNSRAPTAWCTWAGRRPKGPGACLQSFLKSKQWSISINKIWILKPGVPPEGEVMG